MSEHQRLSVPPELQHLIEKRELEERRQNQRRTGSDQRQRDLDPSGAGAAELADQVLTEAAAPPGDPIVAWRGDRRWVQSFERTPLKVGAKPRRQLRHRGVYLVTGGLDDAGLLVAEHLARTVEARLVLTGRSRGAESVRALEALGAEVVTVDADVADGERMREVMALVDERFGELHGVVHAAGAASGASTLRSLVEVGREESENQFRPKVRGLYALEEALAGRSLDFCLLLSSNASILGGPGLVAWSAADRASSSLPCSVRNQAKSKRRCSSPGRWPGHKLLRRREVHPRRPFRT